MVKERPILFSAQMVQAMLANRKSQTRRIITPQFGKTWGHGVRFGTDVFSVHVDIAEKDGSWKWIKCPYGKVGDRLWVKETFRFPAKLDSFSPSAIGQKSLDADYRRPWAPIEYVADSHRKNWNLPDWGAFGKTRVSIHMPRWASRITLELTELRVERLHQITEEAAIAEGVGPGFVPWYDESRNIPTTRCVGHRPMFARLWREINGEKSWDENPWVWCVSFKRIESEVAGG